MINCILFSEFNVRHGPSLVYSYPVDYLSKDQFDAFSDILIPRPELCGKVTTVCMSHSEEFIVGLPVIIVNDKYERQKIEFNWALIIPKDEYKNLRVYENIVRKLADCLVTLELENEFLSNPSKQQALAGICEDIFRQFRETGKCYISIDTWNFLALELFTQIARTPIEINSWDVPIPLESLNQISDEIPDITVKKLKLFIDGTRPVKKIAEEANLNEKTVKDYLKNLYYYKLIEIVDILQPTNIYRITEKILNILSDLADIFVRNISKSEDVDEFTIMNYYYSLSDVPLNNFIESFPEIPRKIYIEKMITYGIIFGVIERVHVYPVVNNLSSSLPVARGNNDTEILSYLDGTHSLDEIFCQFGYSKDQFDRDYGEVTSFYYK